VLANKVILDGKDTSTSTPRNHACSKDALDRQKANTHVIVAVACQEVPAPAVAPSVAVAPSFITIATSSISVAPSFIPVATASISVASSFISFTSSSFTVACMYIEVSDL